MEKQPKPKVEPQFSQPGGQLTSMVIVLFLVAAGLYVGRAQISGIFWSNPYLNGAILAVFVIGVLSTFLQVYQLMRSVGWIEGFAANRVGHQLTQAPTMLAPLATLLRSRGATSQISASSSRSIQESVAQRIDEDREITRYIGNTLIFLGLLGTFYGLATTVPALVETIRSLNPGDGESGADVFGRLQQGLESQLGGMGTAFSSSLLGLAGSLVVGLLELFASHGQNRFYRELEEWLSTITRMAFASGDEAHSDDNQVLGAFAEHMAEQLDTMQMMFNQVDARNEMIDRRLEDLMGVIAQTGAEGERNKTEEIALLRQMVDGQAEMLTRSPSETAPGASVPDTESRQRLRSIDKQLEDVKEDIITGRRRTLKVVREDIAKLIAVIEQKGS